MTVASRGQLNYLKFFLVLQDEVDDLVPVYAELNLALPWGGPALRARIFLHRPRDIVGCSKRNEKDFAAFAALELPGSSGVHISVL